MVIERIIAAWNVDLRFDGATFTQTRRMVVLCVDGIYRAIEEVYIYHGPSITYRPIASFEKVLTAQDRFMIANDRGYLQSPQMDWVADGAGYPAHMRRSPKEKLGREQDAIES